MTTYRTTRKGFTLVEILIVVIILGILAAIVIPQFSNASQDARRSSLQSTVQTLRSQIELYKLQHGDAIPDVITAWDPLTKVSTYGGVNFGPYMQSTPTNQMVDPTVESVVAAGSSATAPDGKAGFYFEAASGKIWGAGKNTAGDWILVGD